MEPRYRIRVNWQMEHHGFTTISRSEWNTYDLTGPITTLDDALRQAKAAFESASYNVRTTLTGINDYIVEQV